jgi:hypothetical protein
MKALEKSIYAEYDVHDAFKKIIFSEMQSYDGTKKEKLKAFLEDMQRNGCISGMVSQFIYHADCRKFYIEHLDDLEDIRKEMEDSLGEGIQKLGGLLQLHFRRGKKNRTVRL